MLERGIRVPVKFLTEFSSTPGLAVFAFRFAQTKTSLRPSNPKRHKAVYVAKSPPLKSPHALHGDFQMAEREGFEPSIQGIPRMTV